MEPRDEFSSSSARGDLEVEEFDPTQLQFGDLEYRDEAPQRLVSTGRDALPGSSGVYETTAYPTQSSQHVSRSAPSVREQRDQVQVGVHPRPRGGHVQMRSMNCTQCSQTVGQNDTDKRAYVNFPCEHIMHLSCFELAKIRTKGTVCPSCFGEQRFDKMVCQEMETGKKIMNIDSTLACVVAEMYASGERGANERWIQLCSSGQVLETADPELGVWTRCRHDDMHELGRRANMKNYIVKTSIEDAEKALSLKRPVDALLAKGVTNMTFVHANIGVDHLFTAGYTLRDLYDLGFKEWTQMVNQGVKMKHLSQTHRETGTVILPVEELVSIWAHSFTSIVRWMASEYAQNVHPSPVHFKKAVSSFCAVQFTRTELSQLSLTSAGQLMNFGGLNALTPDALVDLCGGDGIRTASAARDWLKVDGELLAAIGFGELHAERLGWSKQDMQDVFGMVIKDPSMRGRISDARSHARARAGSGYGDDRPPRHSGPNMRQRSSDPNDRYAGYERPSSSSAFGDAIEDYTHGVQSYGGEQEGGELERMIESASAMALQKSSGPSPDPRQDSVPSSLDLDSLASSPSIVAEHSIVGQQNSRAAKSETPTKHFSVGAVVSDTKSLKSTIEAPGVVAGQDGWI